jgi:glycosyltransferase involved in cell wall biosynthesis
MKTICLNMIVKGESRVIQRALASVKHLIDYWVIVDTGSTDGTQDLIRDFLHDIPGELHERPWVDFAHNRNEALAFAKNKADYLLFIDADERLIFKDCFVMQSLDKDCYFVTYRHGDCDSHRVLLINQHIPWRWEGILHEELKTSQAKSSAFLQDVVNISMTEYGFRSRDLNKYLKDAELLEKVLKEDPENARYVFHLAGSYEVSKRYDLALKNYEKRAAMGGYHLEVYYSLYRIAWIQEKIGEQPQVFINSYCKAYQYLRSRAEPLFCLADHFIQEKFYLVGYLILKFALCIPLPNDAYFVQTWIYEHGLLAKFAECAYYMKKYSESRDALQKILNKPAIPLDVRREVEKNILVIDQLLSEKTVA